MRRDSYIFPLCIIGVLFFTVGFALGINSYLVPLLQSTLDVSSAQSYLIIAATFSSFLLFSYPAALLISRIGYKKTMATAFLLFAAGFALFIPSARLMSLPLFLLASFVCGVANTVLQAAINPYVTILGPIDSAAKRISIMGICNSLAWPIAPIFLSAIIGKNIEEAVLTDLYRPFVIISLIAVVLGIMVFLAPLEEIKAAGEDGTSDGDDSSAGNKTSVWQFPHLVLGAIALFMYVGVETLALSTTVDYAVSLGLDNPQSYAIWPSIGMAVGYICGIIAIPKYVSQSAALKICCWIALICSVLTLVTPAGVSIWFVAFLGFACSLMYPAIWPLAIVDLGKFTKVGSSLLVASIGGGGSDSIAVRNYERYSRQPVCLFSLSALLHDDFLLRILGI